MTYVQVEQGLATHPKTQHLARLIGQHPRYAVGLLHEIWDWALDAKPDGMIGDVPKATIERVFGFKKKDLVALLAEAGFVCSERCLSAGLPADVHRTGRLHDWDRYSGKLVGRRESDRLRKEHERSGHVRPMDGCPRCPPTSSGQGAKPSTNGADRRSESAGLPTDRKSLSVRSVPSVPSVPTPKPPGGGAGQAGAQLLAHATGPWRDALEVLRSQAAEAGHEGSFATVFVGTALEVTEHVALVRVPNALALPHVREYTNAMRSALAVVLDDPSITVRVELAA